jgi:hypothetical protein
LSNNHGKSINNGVIGESSGKANAEIFLVRFDREKVNYEMSEGSYINGKADSAESLNDVYSPDRSHHELSAPPGKRRRGHPTTARDKAPYKTKDKRSRFCTICRGKGHKCTTCPLRGDAPIKPRQAAKCSNCGLAGHRKTSCVKPMYFSG